MLARIAATSASRLQHSTTHKEQRRSYALGGLSSYFSSYIPPTGQLEKAQMPDQTPFDNDHRPRRRRAQIMSRIGKILNEQDYYSIFKDLKKPLRPARPIDIPAPRNGMTVEKFLKTIGRGCEDHIEKFESWDALFSMRGRKMRTLEIPIRQRKWICFWAERYRNGIDPWYIPLHSRTKRNMKLEWRWRLITQKEKRAELGLD